MLTFANSVVAGASRLQRRRVGGEEEGRWKGRKRKRQTDTTDEEGEKCEVVE